MGLSGAVFNSVSYLKDDLPLMAKRLRGLANAGKQDPAVSPDDRAAMDKAADDAEKAATFVTGFAGANGIG